MKKSIKKVNYKLSAIVIIVSIIAFSSIFLAVKNLIVKKNITKKYEVYQVKEKDPLLFKGSVETAQNTNLYLDESLGKLKEIHVHDGQTVEVGTVLLSYQNETIQDQINEQTRMKDRSLSNVNNTEKSLAEVKVKKKTAEENLATAKNNLITIENSEDLEKEQQYNQDIIKYETTVEGQNTQIDTLEVTLSGYRADLEDNNTSLASLQTKVKTEIKADIAGIVYLNEEGKVSPQVPMIQIISPMVSIQGQVSEYDYNKIALEQLVTIRPVSTKEIINGKIIEIDQLPQQKAVGEESTSGLVKYNFKVTPEKTIQYGYSVQISLAQTELVIPRKAVKKEKEQHVVYLYQNGKVKKQSVVLLEKNGQYIVKEGLERKAKIIENPDKKLKDNQEVAVSK